jgi:G2/mitotic-specific cyclin-B, other
MMEKEPLYAVDFEYLVKIQNEVKDTSRGFLVEWIIDVHRKFRLQPETLYVTVSTIDRYLSKVCIKKT